MSRWSDMSGATFTDDSAHHVTVYRLGDRGPFRTR